MRVFVSHSSEDEELVGILVTLLQTALSLTSEDIRCTSLPGFGLPTGSNILDSLREDVREAPVTIGLITPHSLGSFWVIFELGARWGLKQNIMPLCANGLAPHELPVPLRSLVVADCRDRPQLQKLLEDIAKILNIRLTDPSTHSRFIEQIVEKASVPKRLANQSESTQEGIRKSTKSQSKSNEASNARLPKLILEWADLDSGKNLSAKFSLTSLTLDAPPPESLQLERSRDALGLPIDPFENTNFLQEVVEYAGQKALFSPLSLRIKNANEATSRRVRFVGVIKKTDGLSVRDELAPVPEKSLSLSSRLYQGERNEADEVEVFLRDYDDRWEVIIDYGDVRPHDIHVSCPLYFGSTLPQTVRLEGELRGDDLKTPIDCLLEVSIETERRHINWEDVRPFLEED